MKTSVALPLALALLGCASGSARNGKPVAAGEAFAGNFIDIRAPASDGWQLMQSSVAGMSFAKQGEPNGESLVAEVRLFPLLPTGTPKEFETLIRSAAKQGTDSSRFDVQEESFEYTAERGYPCVRYQSLSLDKTPQGSSKPLLLALDGIYCRHPVRQEAGFAALYSFRGTARRGSLRTEAESFAQGIQVPRK